MVEDDGRGPVASDGEVVLEAVPVEVETEDPAVEAQEEADQVAVEVDLVAVEADPVAAEAEDTILQVQQDQGIILIPRPRSSESNRT